MTSSSPTLFDPVTLGELDLPNRIVMASMSRARTANPGLVPIPIQAEYYRQRASAGLILTEGTWPSREAIGAADVPGLFDDAQVEGWKRVTEAVHEAGGRIVVQLGHTGAASHPALLGGAEPLAPSAVGLNAQVFADGGFRTTPVPRAMSLDDIRRTVDDYGRATRLAQQAGFDGVELHGIVGYLVPEFLSDRFNLREDEYGGSVENRARFPLEVLAAMTAAWRPGRIGVKLSPSVGLADLQPTEATIPTYEHLVARAGSMGLAYIQFYESSDDLTNTPVDPLATGTARHFRQLYAGSIIANGGFDRARADIALASGDADAIAFGASYLANPDLVERLRDGIPLAPVPPKESWYGGGAEGYIDYPRAT
ncbi:alkene reductase [Sphingomonas sp. ZT3P38]|uniref:alkene reductase n=1 Tax=Parasphingomonas zepuensis TaxID=3096161 RepID=UPI002FCBF38E